MVTYQLTNKAESEIGDIYEDSILNFGLRIAQEYVTGLHHCFELLADNQSWGNDYGFIKPELLRYEYRSHSVYYQPMEYGILIVRILGCRQDPALHI